MLQCYQPLTESIRPKKEELAAPPGKINVTVHGGALRVAKDNKARCRVPGKPLILGSGKRSSAVFQKQMILEQRTDGGKINRPSMLGEAGLVRTHNRPFT